MSCGCQSYSTFPFTFPFQNQAAACGQDPSAAVSDERYRSLLKTQAGQILTVPLGSNTQAYLALPTGQSPGDFFVVLGADGQARGTRSPSLFLSLLNPMVSSAYPNPASGWPTLVAIGAGGNWMGIQAPTAGKWVLQVDGGAWVLKDAGSIPGINEVGGTSTTALKGQLLLLTEPTDGNFILSKLRVNDKHVVVGFEDDDGTEGFKTLPDGEYLTHPLAKLTALQNKTYQALDAGGAPVSGGLPQATVTGGGSISDPVRMVYSPTTMQFYKAPAGVVTSTRVTVNSSSDTPPSSYTALFGGHGAGTAATYNYPTVRIDFTAGMNSGASSNNQFFAIYRDGSLIAEFDNDNGRTVAICYYDQNVPFGSHTYDVRWKITSGTTAVIIKNSYLSTSTYQL